MYRCGELGFVQRQQNLNPESKSFKPTDQQLTQRHSLQRKLQSIVNKHFGNFEVQHVGLGRYAIDSRDSPYEFALVVSVLSVLVDHSIIRTRIRK